MLIGTKTVHVINALNQYCHLYSGPPYQITTDGGPQFRETNKEISVWARDMGISHHLSSAYSLQSNGRLRQQLRDLRRSSNMLKELVSN